MYNINLMVTEKCNLQCEYCFRDVSVEEEMSLDAVVDFLLLVKEKHRITSCTITGGEPMLYSDIKPLLEFVTQVAEKTCLLTNGILLNDILANYLEKLNIHLHVSLDSYRNLYHDKVRGKQQIVVDNISRIANTTSIRGTICTVLAPGNIEEITNLSLFADQIGWEFEYSVLALGENDDSMWENINMLDKQQAVHRLEELSQNKRDDLKLKLFEAIINRRKININSCLFARNNITIFPDGNIYACYFNPETYFGNIYRDVHDSILQRIEEYRNKSQKIKCFSSKCFGVYL